MASAARARSILSSEQPTARRKSSYRSSAMNVQNLTWLRNHVNEIRQLFFPDKFEPALQSRAQIRRISHWPFGLNAERLRHFGEIYCRIVDMSADAGVFHRAVTKLGDLDAMLLGIIKRLIVVHYHEQRNPVFGRGPERARCHQQVAVRLDVDGELTGIFERQCRADGCARAIPHARTAAAAEILVGLGEIPQTPRPAVGSSVN